MSSIKPLKLYSHAGGPNPWKVVIILLELGVPYEAEYMDFSNIKQEPFISVNPNGRVPAIEDPNTGITLWESGAIIDYLMDTYDKEGKLHYTESPEKYTQRCWRDFQMSGQGPYYGQLAWFSFFHPEKGIQSAIDRYANEVRRVLGVIDLHLTKTGKPYLVGDKITYADLMFFPWNSGLDRIVGPDFPKEWEEKMPKAWEWHQKLTARESVKKMQELKAEKANH